jgi:hypothetical protein
MMKPLGHANTASKLIMTVRRRLLEWFHRAIAVNGLLSRISADAAIDADIRNYASGASQITLNR